MVRRPSTTPLGTPPPPAKPDREKIIDAFMALLAERPFEEIDFTDVAGRAGVSLVRCREEFNTLIGVLAAQVKEIDRTVLAGGEDMSEEPPRERLFDILMRRLEALAPHKEAVRSLARSSRCNPGLALALNSIALRSQSWMLAAAGISTSGLRGAARSQGMACLYADVMRTWLDDDDPGLARTMAALDRQLARGARWSRFLDDICRCVPRPRGRRPWRDERRSDPGEQPAVI